MISTFNKAYQLLDATFFPLDCIFFDFETGGFVIFFFSDSRVKMPDNDNGKLLKLQAFGVNLSIEPIQSFRLLVAHYVCWYLFQTQSSIFQPWRRGDQVDSDMAPGDRKMVLYQILHDQAKS